MVFKLNNTFNIQKLLLVPPLSQNKADSMSYCACSITVKTLKIWAHKMCTVSVFRNGTGWFHNACKHPGNAGGKTNSVDPDQTAPIGAV